jgi:hypothetical protein
MKAQGFLRGAPLGAALAASLLAHNQAIAQTNSMVVESQILAVPVDLEVSPNGLFSVVRGNIPGNISASNQKVSVWRNDTGVQITPAGVATVGRGNLPWVSSSGKPLFSDAVAITNNSAIVVGSAAVGSTMENTTYVDILALSSPGAVSVTQTHVLGGGTNATTMAGEAHDVAITPDGALAVVSHRNWIHVFNMASGDLMAEFNIGDLGDPGLNDPCLPGSSRNSVAVTDTRAIVTAARVDSNSFVHTWVYVLNLTSSADMHIMFEHELDPQSTSGDESPHDVAISPDGQLAVVTANTNVGLYSLGSAPSYLGGYHNSTDVRTWSQNPELWDSVDVSNSRAVVLANQMLSGAHRWKVTVFDISGSGLSPIGSSLGGDPINNAGAAWDVSLSGDGQVASIKTANHDVALLNVPAGTSSSFIAGAGFSTLEYSGTSFGNDATVVMTPIDVDPPQRWAAFMGLAFGGVHVRFYNLNLLSPGSTAYTVPLADSSQGLQPADIELSPSGLEVTARLSAGDSDSGAVNGLDWSRFAGPSPALVSPSFGALGTYSGADSLRTRRNTSVSISRNPDQQFNNGWIHIVRVL